MRLQKRLAAALFVFVLAVPAYAAPERDRGFDPVFDRVAKAIKRILIRLPIGSGDGTIPPIPEPPKP